MNRPDFLGQLMAGSAALGAYQAITPSEAVAQQQPTPLSTATGVALLRIEVTVINVSMMAHPMHLHRTHTMRAAGQKPSRERRWRYDGGA